MESKFSKFVLLALGLLLFHAGSLSAVNTKIMNNFYSFQFPTNKDLSWGPTNDKHVYDTSVSISTARSRSRSTYRATLTKPR